LDRIPTIVALSPFLDETSELADFVLPTSVFLESWECTTTPSTVPYATLGVGSPVLGPLFDTRSAGDVVLELGRRIDSTSPAFSQWADYQDFIHQRLEGLAVAGQGSVFKGPVEEAWAQFLEERGWRFMEYTEFGTLWADLVNHGGWWNPSIPTVAWSQMFRTPSGRFEFWPQLLERKLEELGSTQAGSGENAEGALVRGLAAAGLDDEEGAGCLPHFEPPLSLGDGEVRLMTFRPITARGRLGVSSAMLLEMFGHHHLSGWETWAELNPDTARELGLGDGDIVALESEAGTARVVVRLQPGGTPGLVHVPLGLGHSGGIGPSAGVGSNPVELLPIIRDSLSGSLALNGLQARLRLLRRRPHGGPAPTHGAHSP
jgi:anaerobic selenocysteine-containing dehydrogenase